MYLNMRNQIFLFSTLICLGTTEVAQADNTNYLLAARQYNLIKNMDRIADMTANANTTGFKAEDDIFTHKDKRTSKKEKLIFSNIGRTVRNDSQGVMVSTGRQLDAAINGKGFFMVTTPYGQMYTRSGNFFVSRDGILVNQDGYSIGGPSGGQVEFTEKDIDISIKEDGVVTAQGEERGQIGVFIFDNDQELQRIGNGLYKTSQTSRPASDYKVAQGMLENSNVNSVTAMTSLISTSRNFENVTKVAETHNDMQLNMIRKMTQ